jgi:hypothetical protein
MQVRDWVEMMSRSGQVCSDYMRRLSFVENREDVFRVLCDANGGQWLFDIHAKGTVALPTDEFVREFKAYVNGGKVMEYPQGYSSKFYCRYKGDVVADTTLVYMMECNEVHVTVPENAYPSVILSRCSSASFAMMPGARLNIEVYGDAEYSVSGDMSRVRITKNG